MDEIAQPLTATRGVAIGSTHYAWRERIDATALALRAVRDRVSLLVNLVGLLSFVFGLVAFAYLAFFVGQQPVLDSAFWLTPSTAGFFFSLGLFAACFVFYRMVAAAAAKVKMPRRLKDAPLPSIIDLPPAVKAVNVADFFAPEARQAVAEAYELARRYHHRDLDPLHLFVGAMVADEVAVAFGRLGIKFEQIKEPLARRLQTRAMGEPTSLSARAQETLLDAFQNAYWQGRRCVSGLEIFFAGFKRDEFLQELLYSLQVDERRLGNVVAWMRINGKMRERFEQFKKAAIFKPVGPMNRAMTSVATPFLDSLSEDLTTQAVSGTLPMLVGRERELDETFRVIEGGRQSVVLVGPPGTGKSAVISGIAELMVEERVPDILKDKRLVSLSIPHLLSGASPAQAQERLMQILLDVSRSRNIILAIPNLEQLTGVSGGGAATADLAALLVDFLERGATFAVATATPDAYASVIERSVLGRVFEKVDVAEPDLDTSIQILESKIGGIEYENKVFFSYEALEKAVELSDRYLHEHYLPDKAIDVCREAALDAFKKRGQNALVAGEDVAGVIADKTNIPVTQVSQEEKDKLLNLEAKMRVRMVGQAEAVGAVAAALRRARAELRSQKRPIATFLFLGPTGVGKTELAKTVAETYFGSEEAMLRFDMSEYQEQGSVARLLGVPGSSQGGLLTEAVRRQPFSIVLLDELEKAHPDILNLFLQVFDDGRLTDAAGRTVDFTNTIIVATSNAGALYIQDAVRAATPLPQVKTHLLEEELRGIYRPEFLNRFDGIIVFTPLSPSEVEQIAYLMVNQVAARLEPKGIHFKAADEVIASLAAEGYDPKFGARPLRRLIQEKVDNAIAEALLSGRVSRRDTIILKPGNLIDIEKAPPL